MKVVHCKGDLLSKRSEIPKLIKYVCVRSDPDSRFVEFDFAINDPSLFVELVMPKEAFTIFCKKNDVSFVTEEQKKVIDTEMNKWRYGKDTLMAENHKHKE